MTERKFIDRYGIPWIALVLAIISFAIVLYLKWVFIFESANFAAALTSVSEITAFIGLGLGLLSIRRWQGVIGILLAGTSLYFILFERLWGVS